MKLLIDIDDNLFRKVKKLTRAKTKKEAIVIPMQEYLKLQKRKELADILGKFDMKMTLPELKRMRKQWKKS
jgi:Arc/MetJ family transcription regulator